MNDPKNPASQLTKLQRLKRFWAKSLRGFTLIEMAVAVAVAAILVATVTPSFIETARTNLVEDLARDVSGVQDAAKWYWIQSGVDRTVRRWPGSTGPFACNGTAAAARNDLMNTGVGSGPLLANDVFDNPWMNPPNGNFGIVITKAQGTVGGVADPTSIAGVVTAPVPPLDAPPHCRLQISTPVPNGASGIFQRLLPSATCGAVCGPLPGGLPGAADFTQCCTFIFEPGTEMSISAQPAEMTDALCDSLGGVYDGVSRCRIPTDEDAGGGCTWRNGDCLSGESVSDTRCQGKYCNIMQKKCCPTSNPT